MNTRHDVTNKECRRNLCIHSYSEGMCPCTCRIPNQKDGKCKCGQPVVKGICSQCEFLPFACVCPTPKDTRKELAPLLPDTHTEYSTLPDTHKDTREEKCCGKCNSVGGACIRSYCDCHHKGLREECPDYPHDHEDCVELRGLTAKVEEARVELEREHHECHEDLVNQLETALKKNLTAKHQWIERVREWVKSKRTDEDRKPDCDVDFCTPCLYARATNRLLDDLDTLLAEMEKEV